MKDSLLHKLDFFFTKYKPLRFARREIILRAGDQPQGIFYLKRGYVRVYSISKNGEELTLIIFKPGDIFPLSWAINNVGSDYFVESLTTCELWRVPKDEFLKFVANSPDVLFEINSRLLDRLLGLMRRMEYLVFGDAYSKVCSILLICAQRFGKKSGGRVEITVPLTHNDIATLVGMSRETVSIEMKKLEKQGFIEYRKHFLVVKKIRGLGQQSQLES